ncbi:MAG TPA: OmpA family protein [Stellaceae bacterium]|jgi:outer membrane protein OmpA-like peptidoglycan-associated protein|nr:OmpA family protein [Stellaceae bacterium]
MGATKIFRFQALGLGLVLALALLPLKAHAEWRGHGGFRGGFGVFIGGWPGYYPYYAPYYGYYPPYPYYYPPYYAPAYYRPPPPPPAYGPAPAAAPAPLASQGRDFRVFFDFDKANLTRDGERVVREAAETYRRTGAARVEVTGYTDLSGTPQYDEGLSKQRADAVRAALVAQGVPAGSINESWRGKQSPLVRTADGVREAQNRRVDIVLP